VVTYKMNTGNDVDSTNLRTKTCKLRHDVRVYRLDRVNGNYFEGRVDLTTERVMLMRQSYRTYCNRADT
jgi:hypothetical protein